MPLATAADAETAKITQLGGQDGEFCQLDRALVLEGPDGARLWTVRKGVGE